MSLPIVHWRAQFSQEHKYQHSDEDCILDCSVVGTLPPDLTHIDSVLNWILYAAHHLGCRMKVDDIKNVIYAQEYCKHILRPLVRMGIEHGFHPSYRDVGDTIASFVDQQFWKEAPEDMWFPRYYQWILWSSCKSLCHSETKGSLWCL